MFSQREKIIFFAALAVFVSALAFQWPIVPLLNKNRALDAEITAAKASLVRYRGLLSRKNDLEQAYTAVFSGPQIALAARKTGHSLLTDIDGFAAGSGIRVLDVRPQEAGQDAASAGYELDIRAEGELSGLMKFINTVERACVAAQIKRLQLSVKSNSGMLDAGLTLAQPDKK